MSAGSPDFSLPQAQPFLRKAGSHGVLFIHGFTGSVAHMRPLADALFEAGYTVMGINLPGHATKLEDMRPCTWKTWLDAAEEALAKLQGLCSKVAVSGLSMGGVLSLLLAARHPELSAVIPISAPMGTQNKLLPFARLADPIKPIIYWSNDPSRAYELNPDYDLGYAGFPTVSGSHLWKLIRMARKAVPQIACPLLVVQSDADETITADSADYILSHAGSPAKQLLMLHGVPHVCTISKELPILQKEFIAFLQKHSI